MSVCCPRIEHWSGRERERERENEREREIERQRERERERERPTDGGRVKERIPN